MNWHSSTTYFNYGVAFNLYLPLSPSLALYLSLSRSRPLRPITCDVPAFARARVFPHCRLSVPSMLRVNFNLICFVRAFKYVLASRPVGSQWHVAEMKSTKSLYSTRIRLYWLINWNRVSRSVAGTPIFTFLFDLAIYISRVRVCVYIVSLAGSIFKSSHCTTRGFLHSHTHTRRLLLSLSYANCVRNVSDWPWKVQSTISSSVSCMRARSPICVCVRVWMKCAISRVMAFISWSLKILCPRITSHRTEYESREANKTAI